MSGQLFSKFAGILLEELAETHLGEHQPQQATEQRREVGEGLRRPRQVELVGPHDEHDDERHAGQGGAPGRPDIYDVTGIAVHAPWLLGKPDNVTTDLDVNRAYADEFYQANPRVSVEEVDGRWYLSAPLLAPTPAEL